MHKRDPSDRPARRFLPLVVLIAFAAGGLGAGLASALDAVKYRDLCDDVPQDIPPNGDYTEVPTDDRDWGKRIEACNTLLKGKNPDPDLFYYAGRLEFKEQNFSRAEQLFRQGAEAGSVKAMTALALYLAPRDPEGMLKWFHEAAERGDPMAQTALGLTYSGLAPEWADAVQPDHERAREYLEAAAAQGDPVAHLFLGAMAWPEQKEGNDSRLKEALEHVRTAARSGLPEARQMLREKGHDVPDIKPDQRWPRTTVSLLRMMNRP